MINESSFTMELPDYNLLAIVSCNVRTQVLLYSKYKHEGLYSAKKEHFAYNKDKYDQQLIYRKLISQSDNV